MDGEEFACAGGKLLNVSLMWNPVDDPAGISQYEVELVETSGLPRLPAVSREPIDADQTQVAIPCRCGVSYGWRVRAVDGAGNLSLWSEERAFSVSDTPVAAPVLLAPANEAEIPCSTEAAASVILSWEPGGEPTGINQYELELTKTYGAPPVPSTASLLVDGGQAQASISAECGASYEWRVRELDAAGNPGPWSERWSFSTGVQLPPQADLEIIDFRVPRQARRGDSIKDQIDLVVTNQDNGQAGAFFVDIVISPDAAINASDQLLVGGREHVAGVAPGEQVTVGMAGEIIPEDWPAGDCYIGAILDSTGAVAESDEHNNTAARPITIEQLAPDLSPTVHIIDPAEDTQEYDPEYRFDGSDNELGFYFTDVSLKGSANDPEDGVLSGNALQWTTNRRDIHETPVLGIGMNLQTRLYSDLTCGEHAMIGDWHEITLTATDSAGNVSTAVRNIHIWDYCGEPEVRLSAKWAARVSVPTIMVSD
jgi:hypothetical protein